MMFDRTIFVAACVTFLYLLPAAGQDVERDEVEPLGRSAGSVAGELEQERDPGRQAALRESAKAYAREFGVTTEVAVTRLRQQETLQSTLGALEEQLGGAFAGAYIEHQPRLHGVVEVAEGGQVNEEAKQTVERSEVPIEVIETTRAPLEELTRRLQKALPRLRELGGGLAGAEIDVRTGEIVLFYQTGSSADTEPEARKRAQDAARKLLDVPLRIEEVEAPVGDGHTRGGADLSTCTTGFVVRHPENGVRGFITAGHCGNNQTFFEFGGTSYSTAFVDEIRDSDQDVQWHTTPHIELPRFYASSTTFHRPLTSRRTRSQQSVGGYVCHRGKTTGYSCGRIQSKWFWPTYNNACPGTICLPVWVRVSGSNLKCFPGDSGGPWFLVYSAYGIYKGQASTGTTAAGCSWAFYMASNYFGIDLLYD